MFDHSKSRFAHLNGDTVQGGVMCSQFHIDRDVQRKCASIHAFSTSRLLLAPQFSLTYAYTIFF